MVDNIEHEQNDSPKENIFEKISKESLDKKYSIYENDYLQERKFKMEYESQKQTESIEKKVDKIQIISPDLDHHSDTSNQPEDIVVKPTLINITLTLLKKLGFYFLQFSFTIIFYISIYLVYNPYYKPKYIPNESKWYYIFGKYHLNRIFKAGFLYNFYFGMFMFMFSITGFGLVISYPIGILIKKNLENKYYI